MGARKGVQQPDVERHKLQFPGKIQRPAAQQDDVPQLGAEAVQSRERGRQGEMWKAAIEADARAVRKVVLERSAGLVLAREVQIVGVAEDHAVEDHKGRSQYGV